MLQFASAEGENWNTHLVGIGTMLEGMKEEGHTSRALITVTKPVESAVCFVLYHWNPNRPPQVLVSRQNGDARSVNDIQLGIRNQNINDSQLHPILFKARTLTIQSDH